MDATADVVVIGAGLAGLTAAAYLGRAGLAVTVVEKASATGGRAATQQKRGYALNLGAHALYRGGPARAILDELGVRYEGRTPPPSGGYALDGGRLHTLPAGLASLATTGLLPLAAKLELARLLATIGGVDPAPLEKTPLSAWIAGAARAPALRRFLGALFRVTTFAADHEQLSAGAAIRQLQLATRDNVLYLDRGWQVLVDGLREAAVSAGATILTGARAIGVDGADGVDVPRDAVRGVRLDGGGRIAARAVVIAASPAAASALVPSDPRLARCAADASPVRAACLDVALSALPRPTATFALGLDRPIYFSVHSAAAKLAPPRGAVIHLLAYLAPGEHADEAELEALLERMQPGYRDVLVERRFLPSLTVSNAIVTAAGGGLAGRPGVTVPSASGLFVAGDWVGPEGMLADASLASARRAAMCAAELLGERRAA